MELEFFFMILKMILSLLVILILIAVAYKLSINKINIINKNKYINVLERVQISKDTHLCIIKIGSKGHVISTSAGKTDIIQSLSEEEIVEIETKKRKDYENAIIAYGQIANKGASIMNNLKQKFNLKERKDER